MSTLPPVRVLCRQSDERREDVVDLVDATVEGGPVDERVEGVEQHLAQRYARSYIPGHPEG